MSIVAPEIEARLIGRTVANRERALNVLRSTQRVPVWLRLTSMLVFFVVVVSFGFSDAEWEFFPLAIVAVTSAIAVEALATSWYLQRRINAAIDLILLNEDESE